MVWMIRFLAAGAAMLALVACGGGGDGAGKEEASYCQTWCGWAWDCAPEGTRPEMGTREMYVLGCLVSCEVNVDESCPERDEAACKTCLESSLDTQCIPLSESCAKCNCLLPL